ncbi:uncharacterized protein BDW43DRAFT_287822 [Aspergillus alliaceus]|uniref:uncharacterized protein n=1 Tax=Petromyces alliaceus TaxID=209559 RepID=UPI0012A6610B|nr:uncharacterized protein BDW43DRAFT_287822 [Aspergillus alliaceus]KAB8229693.1 hypothetical protein BDW43DRAFT_287822 [Aspergillus alliaceus]
MALFFAHGLASSFTFPLPLTRLVSGPCHRMTQDATYLRSMHFGRWLLWRCEILAFTCSISGLKNLVKCCTVGIHDT